MNEMKERGAALKFAMNYVVVNNNRSGIDVGREGNPEYCINDYFKYRDKDFEMC